MDETRQAMLYFDRDTQRSIKNKERLFGSYVDYGGVCVVSVGRVKTTNFETGADKIIPETPHSAYILHCGSEGFRDVLDLILLSASERGEKPRIGIITPSGQPSLVEHLRKEAQEVGVDAVIESIYCHPDGYFTAKNDPLAEQGRKTIKIILDN